MLLFRILAFIFLIPGVVMVFGAEQFVKKFGLERKVTVDFENTMSEEELEQFKKSKAMVNFKMAGMLVALPGLVFILLGFK